MYKTMISTAILAAMIATTPAAAQLLGGGAGGLGGMVGGTLAGAGNLGGGRKREIGPDGNRGIDPEQQGQQGRHQRAAADAGQADQQADCKPGCYIR